MDFELDLFAQTELYQQLCETLKVLEKCQSVLSTFDCHSPEYLVYFEERDARLREFYIFELMFQEIFNKKICTFSNIKEFGIEEYNKEKKIWTPLIVIAQEKR